MASAGLARVKTSLRAALLVIALASATGARADGVADGSAGLDALNRGAYDEAIRLFTRALLPSGHLSKEDSEFAYLNRGKAYIAKGDLTHGVADLKKALRLNPRDTDAQSALDDAMAKQSGRGGGHDEAPVQEAAAAGRDPWGMLSAMAGKYYWVQVPGHDAHEAFMKVYWFTPQQALSVTVRTKTDQLEVYEYKLDAKTGKVIFAAVIGSKSEYGTIDARATTATAFTFVDGVPVRIIIRPAPDGALVEARQTFVSGGWRDGTNTRLVETTTDELIAQGLMKAKKH
jgi:tetratricopeptide (TPR) repeat protein